MGNLDTSNIFYASNSYHALLDLEWEGIVEGAEEIRGWDLDVRRVGERGAEGTVDFDVQTGGQRGGNGERIDAIMTYKSECGTRA